MGTHFTISDIEKGITSLPPEKLAEFRDWFEKFDAGQWDHQFESDAKAGKLDRLADQALEDFDKGHCKEL